MRLLKRDEPVAVPWYDDTSTERARHRMKRLRRNIAQVLISILIGFMVYGCAKPAVDPIMGRWLETKSQKKSQNFTEFLSNGNFLMSYQGLKKPEILVGRWSKTSDDSFALEMEMLGTPMTVIWEEVRISGDVMKVSISGKSWTYTRIQKPR